MAFPSIKKNEEGRKQEEACLEHYPRGRDIALQFESAFSRGPFLAEYQKARKSPESVSG